jgi:type VI secretion system secreted protein VgrG
MATSPTTQDDRLLKVTTTLGADVLLIDSFSGSEAISGLFQFQLRLLAAGNTQIDGKSLLGTAVSMSMEGYTNPKGTVFSVKRFFHGVASRVSVGPSERSFVQNAPRYRSYYIELVPWVWLLAQRTNSRVFQGKTAVEVIQAVVDDLKKDSKLAALVNFDPSQLKVTYTKRDYCVQYRETDFAFISRLMEEEGISYFFQHEETKHTMVLSDVNATFKNSAGKNPVEYKTPAPKNEEVLSYLEKEIELRSGKHTLRDHHFRLAASDFFTSDSAANAKDGTFTSLEIYDYPGGQANPFNETERELKISDEGTHLIGVLMDEEEGHKQIFEAVSNCRNLTSGFKFTVAQTADFPILSGDYLVTSINHSVGQSPSYISGHDGDAYQNRFACAPLNVKDEKGNAVVGPPYRPQVITPKPVIPGPQTAIVAVKDGEEGWLDKFGRVRVQFLWQRTDDGKIPKPDEKSTCWIRVAQPWAGAGWGAHFWPRKDQEVVVEFLEGDPDRPLITGSVYNSANLPPYNPKDFYTRSGVKTRSSKNGQSSTYNELRFEDKKDAEQIFLRAQQDMDLRVQHDLREWVEDNRHIYVKGKHNEAIKGKMSLHVEDSRHEKIDQVYTVEAGKELHLNVSGGTLVIESSQRISIKVGGSFIDIGPAAISIVATQVNVNSGGSAASGTAVDVTPKPDTADDGSAGGSLGPGKNQ